MGGVSSRSWPYPYSLALGNDGLIVREPMVGRKIQSLAGTVPNTAEYGNDDVYRERSFVFGRATLGMGESVQRTHAGHRYRYAKNCWFAGHKRGKGPKWNNLAPASTGSITDFVEALHGGVLTQFILAGQYVLRRTNDTSATQVVSRDFGAGRTVTSAVRFKPAGGTDSLFVTLDNGDLWRYDGAAWSGPAAAAGTWTGDAFLCCVVADDFYIKDTANTVRRVTADPMVGTNYSGQLTAGDGSKSINGLLGHNNTLFAFLDDGTLATFNTDGTGNDLAPGLATTRLATNGAKPVSDTLGRFYFRNGSSWFRGEGMDGLSLEPIGPERLMDNDSEVSGVAQVFAWYGAYYGYFGVYNANTGASHLVQFGDWVPREDEDGTTFVETFNGSLVTWAGRQISAMRIQFIAGVPRLYCGFTDGTFGWIRLPSNTPNPFSPQSGCEFADGSTGASECVWPRHTMLKEADNKAFLHFQAFGDLDADNRVQVAYRLGDGATYVSLDRAFRQNGQREEFEGDVVGTAIDVRETFVSPSSASTPVMEALILREQLRPSTRLEWFFTVKAHHRVALRNGATDPRTPDQIYARCKRAADNPLSETLTLPDEQAARFHSVNFEVRIPPDTRGQRYGLARDIAMSFVQYRTVETYGIYARLGEMTYGDLGSMTFADAGDI